MQFLQFLCNKNLCLWQRLGILSDRSHLGWGWGSDWRIRNRSNRQTTGDYRTQQYHTTLLLSVNTTALRIFCGAKYTHHTFTPELEQKQTNIQVKSVINNTWEIPLTSSYAYRINIASSRGPPLNNCCPNKRNYKDYLQQINKKNPAGLLLCPLLPCFFPSWSWPLQDPTTQKHPRLDTADMGARQCSSPVDVTSLLHLAPPPTSLSPRPLLLQQQQHDTCGMGKLLWTKPAKKADDTGRWN